LIARAQMQAFSLLDCGYTPPPPSVAARPSEYRGERACGHATDVVLVEASERDATFQIDQWVVRASGSGVDRFWSGGDPDEGLTFWFSGEIVGSGEYLNAVGGLLVLPKVDADMIVTPWRRADSIEEIRWLSRTYERRLRDLATDLEAEHPE